MVDEEREGDWINWIFWDITKLVDFFFPCHFYPPMAWYLGDIVVGWCNTRISASNSQVACGHSLGETITMPFLMEERLIYLKNRNNKGKDSRRPRTAVLDFLWIISQDWMYYISGLQWVEIGRNKFQISTFDADVGDLPPTFFRANEAVWPPLTSFTGIRLRWIDFTAIEMKLPKGSGPSSMVSFRRMSPRKVVPDTTVPTP